MTLSLGGGNSDLILIKPLSCVSHHLSHISPNPRDYLAEQAFHQYLWMRKSRPQGLQVTNATLGFEPVWDSSFKEEAG